MDNNRCYLCGSKQTSLYLGSDKILHCNSCGVVFLAPKQIPLNLDSYYQNNVFYAENADNPDLVRRMIKSAKFYLKIITKYIQPINNNLLIDIGSNYGALVEEASRSGFKAIGLEKNHFLAQKGRRRGLDISENNLVDLAVSFPVKIITAMHVMEHLTDPQSFIKDVYKKLETGGLFIIGIPNIKSYLAKKDGLSWRYIALEHLWYFSEKILCQILKEEGFKVLVVKRDATNLADQSFKKLLHYLAGKPVVRDRFQAKSFFGRNSGLVPKPNWLKRIFKNFLILAIKILHREDFIVIIAKKKE